MSASGWLALAIALGVAACSAPPQPQVYGAAMDAADMSRAARPLSSLTPADTGAEVTAKGTISQVCQTMGCWFYLAEGETLVYVDLEQGSRFTIPLDSKGRRAVIAGTYLAKGGDVRIVAKSAAVWP